MKKIIYFTLFFLKCVSVFSQNFAIDAENILIEKYADGDGFHLWIKVPDDVKSVLITESTADPEKKNDVYTFRTEEFNTINGNEQRILDGKVMSNGDNNYFLIDSTLEDHEELGEVFHIFIPCIIQYGYSWAPRKGEISISDGTFLNIRSFEKPFADYSGAFYDNPFELNIIQVVLEEVLPIVEAVAVPVVLPIEEAVAVPVVLPIEEAVAVPIVLPIEEAVPAEEVIGFLNTSFSVYRKYSLYGLNNGKTNRNIWVLGETIILSP